MTRFRSLALLASTSFLLAACGGGGGDDDNGRFGGDPGGPPGTGSGASTADACAVGGTISEGEACSHESPGNSFTFIVQSDGSGCIGSFCLDAGEIRLNDFSARRNSDGSWEITALPGSPGTVASTDDDEDEPATVPAPPERNLRSVFGDMDTFGIDNGSSWSRISGLQLLYDTSNQQPLSLSRGGNNYRWEGWEGSLVNLGTGEFEAVVYSFSPMMDEKISNHTIPTDSTLIAFANPNIFPIREAGTPEPDGLSFSGSYRGVNGDYTCEANCDYTREQGGDDITELMGSWSFKASNDDQRLESDEDSYAAYGWWLRKSTTGEYTIRAFDTTDSDNTFDSANTFNNSKFTGTANYQGGAAGYYVILSDTATGGTGDTGSFKAKASLTAIFEAGSNPTISGTIDEFKLTGNKNGDDWRLDLHTDQSTTWIIEGEAGTTNESSWRYNLQHQPSSMDPPHLVTGTFEGEYRLSGKLVGGFGANWDLKEE